MPSNNDRQLSLLREIDAALSPTGKRGPLSTALRERIDSDNWRARAQAMRAYFISMCGLMFVMIPVSAPLLPHMFRLALCLQLACALGVQLPTFLLFRRRVSRLTEGLVPCAAVTTQVLLTCYLGSQAQEPRALLHHLAFYISAIFIAYAAVITLRLAIRFAAVLAVACFAVFAGFILPIAKHDVGLGEIGCLLGFYGACLTVAVARRHGFNRMAERAELLALRDDLRLDELTASNTRLLHISNTDALTGVANRRFFTEALDALWQDAIAHRRSLAVILLDIDHFKALNDTFGHAEGDRCLQLVARAIADAARISGDMVARFGGEEFIVLLADTDPPAAQQVAERLRVAVAAISLVSSTAATSTRTAGPHRQHGITASLGVAAAVPPPGSLPTGLIAAADGALYAAKAAGRNCVRVSAGPLAAGVAVMARAAR